MAFNIPLKPYLNRGVSFLFQLAFYYDVTRDPYEVSDQEETEVTLTIGDEKYTATSTNLNHAKQKAAAQALMQTSYTFAEVPPKLSEANS